MNRMNRVSLIIGMLTVLVGIFSSAGLAKNLERESSVDGTVVQIGHWQAMNPNVIDSTVTQVVHWQAMNPSFTDSTVTQVANWQAMNPSVTDSTVTQVAHRQTMNSEFTDSTVTQVAHWLAIAGLPDADETVNIDSGSVAEVIVQR